jgi:hypothetical protein
MPPPTQRKHHPDRIIFAKNVPQESAPAISALFSQYEPLEVKNIYPHARITTIMITLPTADLATTAQHNTDGLRFDNTVLTVERFNATQSTVARREARRGHGGGYHDTSTDEYEGYRNEYAHGSAVHGSAVQNEGPLDWDEESSAQLTPSTTDREVVEGSDSSWANIAKGFISPSLSSPTPAILTTQMPVEIPDTSRTPVPRSSELATTTTTTPSGPPLLTPSTTSYDTFYSASQCPTPVQGNQARQDLDESNNKAVVGEDPSQQTEVSWFAKHPLRHLGRMGPRGAGFDTTENIRRRHCESCSICQMRMKR